jgi:hypothetical protein
MLFYYITGTIFICFLVLIFSYINFLKKFKKDYSKPKFCTICQENYSYFDIFNSNISRLSCDHNFHPKCIKSWFYNRYMNNQSLDCPICKLESKVINKK